MGHPKEESAPSSDDGKGISLAFREALTQPSLPSLVIALATVGVFYLLAFLLITPHSIAHGGYRVFMRESLDGRAMATAKILALAEPPVRDSAVIILGASAIRAGLLSEEEIAESIRQGGGPDVDVQNLTFGAATFLEMIGAVDTMMPNVKGLFVIGVGRWYFTTNQAELDEVIQTPRWGIVSPAMDEEARNLGCNVPRRYGLYLVDNYRFFAARHVFLYRNVLFGSPEPQDLRYLGRPPVSAATWASRALELMETSPSFDTESSRNFEILQRLVHRIRQHAACQVMLVEQPLNPRFISEVLGEKSYEAYLARVRESAKDQDVVYCRPADKAGLAAADFYDWCHINSDAARHRWCNVLIDELIRVRSGLPIGQDNR